MDTTQLLGFWKQIIGLWTPIFWTQILGLGTQISLIHGHGEQCKNQVHVGKKKEILEDLFDRRYIMFVGKTHCQRE